MIHNFFRYVSDDRVKPRVSEYGHTSLGLIGQLLGFSDKRSWLVEGE